MFFPYVKFSLYVSSGQHVEITQLHVQLIETYASSDLQARTEFEQIFTIQNRISSVLLHSELQR